MVNDLLSLMAQTQVALAAAFAVALGHYLFAEIADGE